jgi:DNA-binding NtrC family response regulator
MQRTTQIQVAAPRKPRLLIVDDEEDILESLAPVLEATLGLPVDTAPDALAAQRKLREGSYAAVITDQRMPGMTGSELLSWVQAEKPGVRRVLMSAYLDALLGPEASWGLPHLLLRKPFEVRDMVPALRELLGPALPPA